MHWSAGDEKPIQFFYETIFAKLRLRFPLTAFKKWVLRKLNVALAQLHPNSWAFVKAFQTLFKALGLMPTLGKFFNFFEFTNTKKTIWVSLNSIDGQGILTLYTTSYKNLKGRFFKVRATKEMVVELFDGFPSQQTSEPYNHGRYELEALSVIDPEDIEFKKQLTLFATMFKYSCIIELEYRSVNLRVFISKYLRQSHRNIVTFFWQLLVVPHAFVFVFQKSRPIKVWHLQER